MRNDIKSGGNSLGSDGEYQAMGNGLGDNDLNMAEPDSKNGISIVLVNYGTYAGVSKI